MKKSKLKERLRLAELCKGRKQHALRNCFVKEAELLERIKELEGPNATE